MWSRRIYFVYVNILSEGSTSCSDTNIQILSALIVEQKAYHSSCKAHRTSIISISKLDSRFHLLSQPVFGVGVWLSICNDCMILWRIVWCAISSVLFSHSQYCIWIFYLPLITASRSIYEIFGVEFMKYLQWSQKTIKLQWYGSLNDFDLRTSSPAADACPKTFQDQGEVLLAPQVSIPFWYQLAAAPPAARLIKPNATKINSLKPNFQVANSRIINKHDAPWQWDERSGRIVVEYPNNGFIE